MANRLKSAVKAMFTEPPTLAVGEAPLSPLLPHRLPFQFIGPAVLAFDFIIIVLAAIICGQFYYQLFLNTQSDLAPFASVGLLVFLNFAALSRAQQNYSPTNLINRGRQLRFITLIWWSIFVVLLAVAFTFKVSEQFSRGATLSFFVCGWIGIIISRVIIAKNLRYALKNGTFAEKKVILITELNSKNSSYSLDALRQCGYLPIHTFEITPPEVEATGVSHSLKIKLDKVIFACQQETIDHVILLMDWRRHRLIQNIIRILRVLPVPINLLPDQNVAQFLTRPKVNVGMAWTIELQRAPLTITERAIKRTFDFIGACAAIFLISPLMLIAALLIKIDSSGPVLFRQRRNGFNGKQFIIYKFRTMRVLQDGDVVPQATRNDPRVTGVGRWLRKTNIDELPQLFNVIIGNMSLIGPRPHPTALNNEYQNLVANYAFRNHVKPGITGWAQINGYRGETRTVELMEQRIEHDIWYVNHWTFWLDLRILLKTLVLVHQPTAY